MGEQRMRMVEKLSAKEATLAVVGLGYVGLPLAAAFSHHFRVIGFDVSEEKIAGYRKGHDVTQELGDELLQAASVDFTSDPTRLREADFVVVAVPTPVNPDKTPDLEPVKNAAKLVGENLRPGAIVVFESTVYPGVTEDICLPIVEKASGKKGGVDFTIGYSPERINPGDKVHRLANICKVVSGMNRETMKEISAVYQKIIEAGVYEAQSIRVAEAAKLVENTQRDINIAFMNELAIVCHRMNIKTNDVIDAMDTKWNALHFRPGLVGGHCIGIDPYYFIHEAEIQGHRPRLIATARRVNNDMGPMVAQAVVQEMLLAKIDAARANVYFLGMTFKEDCPDVRNSLPVDIVRWLKEYGIAPHIVDPVADREDFRRLYQMDLETDLATVREADCLVFLVRHQVFRDLTPQQVEKMYRKVPDQQRVLIDVKGIFPEEAYAGADIRYWSL